MTRACLHITNAPGILVHLEPYVDDNKIMVGDDSHLNIFHIGDCVKYKNIKLIVVLVVPKIKLNLVYVSQLARDSCASEILILILSSRMGK